MNYLPNGDLVDVDFSDLPMPTDWNTLSRIFPGRPVRLDDAGQWVGVTCSRAEWRLFLAVAEQAIARVDGGQGALAVVRHFASEYAGFLAWNSAALTGKVGRD